MKGDFELLQEALIGAAQIVACHGKDFLPFFLRLEEVAREMDGNNSAMERAVTMASAKKPRGCPKVQSAPGPRPGPAMRRHPHS